MIFTFSFGEILAFEVIFTIMSLSPNCFLISSFIFLPYFVWVYLAINSLDALYMKNSDVELLSLNFKFLMYLEYSVGKISFSRFDKISCACDVAIEFPYKLRRHFS